MSNVILSFRYNMCAADSDGDTCRDLTLCSDEAECTQVEMLWHTHAFNGNAELNEDEWLKQSLY
jgi:hypothetical protein